jgi:hypothetical protein
LRRFAENDTHAYEVRRRKDHRGVGLISDALPFGRLWYGEPDAISNAIGYAKFFSRSHNAVIETHESSGRVQRAVSGHVWYAQRTRAFVPLNFAILQRVRANLPAQNAT